MELLSTAEMAEADRLTIGGGIPGIDLMENAGRAVARAVLAAFPRGKRIAVVAGPGNNGGDGFVAARQLAAQGHEVRVLLCGDRTKLKGDALLAADTWTGTVEFAAPGALAQADVDVIVDALFGAGLDRPVRGDALAIIEAINASGIPAVAVDLPSGINGNSGAVMGAAVRAARTVTFFRRKPGHVLLPGRTYCGPVEVAQIGISDSVLATLKPKTFANEPALWSGQFPVPRVDAHKYTRGHAVVVSGGMSHTGAARLSARGALRAGAGLVTIASPREALAVNAAQSLAVMVRPVDGAVELAALLQDARLNALVIGPGGGVGPEMREMVKAALAGRRDVVLDADALTSFADNPKTLVKALENRPESCAILTPHEGEFVRFFKSVEQIPSVKQKLEAARAASHETSAIVVLKGPDTVVAAPDGRAAIAGNAPPYLATAGAGDVLAGMIAGLLAQGMPGFEAACGAVWLHGKAAQVAGPGLISEDLPEALPAVYRRIYASLGITP
ncbi:MAG TPA: NAD(P)H-hydrate dehydratase [Bauldia sp.]|nr:NAD(P)H-hydrate dehydratase [Bauldia sp.]